MSIGLDTLQRSSFFRVTEDLDGVQIDQISETSSLRRIAAVFLQTNLMVITFFVFAEQLFQRPPTPAEVIVLGVLMFPLLMGLVKIAILNIFPERHVDLYRQRLNLTDATLTLPGWMFAARKTILLETIQDVRPGTIPHSLSSIFLAQPTGKGIEIETEGGIHRFMFYVPFEEQQPLIQLIQQAVISRKQRLQVQGHDLTERPSVPADLARLRQR